MVFAGRGQHGGNFWVFASFSDGDFIDIHTLFAITIDHCCSSAALAMLLRSCKGYLTSRRVSKLSADLSIPPIVTSKDIQFMATKENLLGTALNTSISRLASLLKKSNHLIQCPTRLSYPKLPFPNPQHIAFAHPVILLSLRLS